MRPEAAPAHQQGHLPSDTQQNHRTEMPPYLPSQLQISSRVDSAILASTGGGGRLTFDDDSMFPTLAEQSSRDAAANELQSLKNVPAARQSLIKLAGASRASEQPMASLHHMQNALRSFSKALNDIPLDRASHLLIHSLSLTKEHAVDIHEIFWHC